MNISNQVIFFVIVLVAVAACVCVCVFIQKLYLAVFDVFCILKVFLR